MKRTISGLLVSIVLIISLTGCKIKLYPTYLDEMEDIHMEYFDAEVIEEDDETCSAIIKNKITGEYFLCVGGVYGMNMTPISISKNEIKQERRKVVVCAGGVEKELEEVTIYKEK